MAAGGAVSAATPEMAADPQKPSLSNLPLPADFCLLKVPYSPKESSAGEQVSKHMSQWEPCSIQTVTGWLIVPFSQTPIRVCSPLL